MSNVKRTPVGHANGKRAKRLLMQHGSKLFRCHPAIIPSRPNAAKRSASATAPSAVRCMLLLAGPLVRREPYLDSAGVVLGLEQDELEPSFFRRELHRVRGTVNSTSAALSERVSYCNCVGFGDEGNQLVPTSRLPPLERLNAQPLAILKSVCLYVPSSSASSATATNLVARGDVIGFVSEAMMSFAHALAS